MEHQTKSGLGCLPPLQEDWHLSSALQLASRTSILTSFEKTSDTCEGRLQDAALKNRKTKKEKRLWSYKPWLLLERLLAGMLQWRQFYQKQTAFTRAESGTEGFSGLLTGWLAAHHGNTRVGILCLRRARFSSPPVASKYWHYILCIQVCNSDNTVLCTLVI